jgi:hypothetical protein
MLNKLQAIQSILNAALEEIGSNASEQVNSILSKVNDSFKIPGMLSTNGSSVFVSNTTYTLPNGKKESLIWDGNDFGGISGSVNFMTEVVSGDMQAIVLPVIGDGEYCKAGFEIRADKKIYVVFGSVNASLGLASFPVFSSMALPLGYSVLLGGPSGLLPIVSGNIFQFFSFPSMIKKHSSMVDRDEANSHPGAAISLDVSGFSGELKSTEANAQLAIGRLEKYGSVFAWQSGMAYRQDNIVYRNGLVWKCSVDHISGATFNEANWVCLEQPQQEIFTVGVGGQSIFTLATITIPEAEMRLQVFVNGVRQILGIHYDVNSSSEVEFTDTISENAEVLFFLA